jgi:hypothetical protein
MEEFSIVDGRVFYRWMEEFFRRVREAIAFRPLNAGPLNAWPSAPGLSLNPTRLNPTTQNSKPN